MAIRNSKRFQQKRKSYGFQIRSIFFTLWQTTTRKLAASLSFPESCRKGIGVGRPLSKTSPWPQHSQISSYIRLAPSQAQNQLLITRSKSMSFGDSLEVTKLPQMKQHLSFRFYSFPSPGHVRIRGKTSLILHDQGIARTPAPGTSFC